MRKKELEKIEPFKKALLKVGKVLKEKGVDFVLVGSLILPLIYEVPWDVHDVDLFITNKCVFAESEFFEEIARENDWDIGTTMHGLIYYEILVNGDIVRVDLMENILDIYIPEEMLKNAPSRKIDDLEIRHIRLEDLIILKAREATQEGEEFLNKLAEYLAEEKYNLRINKNYFKKALEYFPEDERQSIYRRILKCGIYIE
ncbi:MAG: nucleotidyltransferase [Crenarchaeota archaeon]|nr:nucleotidyltransferase [Thermoproteota archaeon]